MLRHTWQTLRQKCLSLPCTFYMVKRENVHSTPEGQPLWGGILPALLRDEFEKEAEWDLVSF